MKKIRAEYRAKDDLKLNDKTLKSLYSIGFTAAHVMPEKGIFKGKSDLVVQISLQHLFHLYLMTIYNLFYHS